VNHYKGRLAETLLERYQNATARLYCPPLMKLPKAGQYMQLVSPHDELQAVPVSAFASGAAEQADGGGFLLPILADLPERWQPGDELSIRGPLGRGFELPKRAKRVALAALAGNPGRLLPLASAALAQGCEVALCTDAAVASLPAAVELRGLADLPAVIAWGDFLAFDIKIEELEGLEEKLGMRSPLPRALEAQALVVSPMPCGGMAKCGVCAVPAHKGERLLCEDGPVVELREMFPS
jgi:hypothetical protein